VTALVVTAPNTSSMAFKGIPLAAVEFYEGLAADNSRAYWQANKATYDDAVRGSLAALCEELESEFGTAEFFRPYRDTRFSTNKDPYKTYQGVILPTHAGCGYYLELSALGLRTGGGYHAHGADQVARYREAVDEDKAGSELAAIVTALAKGGLTLTGDALKTKPRGVPDDHPRLDLLRQRDVVVERMHGAPKWLATRKALEKVRADWEAVRPLNDWLAEHVGPSVGEASRWRR